MYIVCIHFYNSEIRKICTYGAISDDSRKILLNHAMTTNQNVEIKQLILIYYELHR